LDGASDGSYYESADLKKFGEIGRHAKALADDFFGITATLPEPTVRSPSARRR
jgi:hypothetical protein